MRMTKRRLILPDPQRTKRGRRGKTKTLRKKKPKKKNSGSELKMPLLPLPERQLAESRGAAFCPGAGRIVPERTWQKPGERPPRERTDT